MEAIWMNALISTVVVSSVSLIGIFLLFFKIKNLQKIILVLVSFSVGTLLGNSFFHLLPEAFFHIHPMQLTAWLIVGGFLLSFLLEQLLNSYHSHRTDSEKTVKTYGYLSLYADGIHNFTDGILIGASWMVSPEMGITTTIAIMMHEIPQEISDFGILIKAGFEKRKALLYNFFSAATAVVGTVVTLWAGSVIEHFTIYILPIAAGGFIYLAASALLPEVVKETTKQNFWIHLIFLFLGFLVMYYFASTGTHHHH